MEEIIMLIEKEMYKDNLEEITNDFNKENEKIIENILNLI